MSVYEELAPPPALAAYVGCLWFHQVGERTYEHPVLPDGCIDVVAVGERVLLAGPATSSTTVRLEPDTLTVGVRFRPGAAPAMLGASAAELRDLEVSLDALWGRAGAEFADRVIDASDATARLGVMVDALVRGLGDARLPDPVGVGIARALSEGEERSVTALAAEFALSERQLRRRVEEAVGYSPRVLARVLRFQRFLRLARRSTTGRRLARLAIDAGYADQAHLTRESRALAGLPPAALLDWEAQRLGG